MLCLPTLINTGFTELFDMGNASTTWPASSKATTALQRNVSSVVLHTAAGEPFTAPNRICIFEFDPGYPLAIRIAHAGVPGIETHHSRRATNLVVRMAATIETTIIFRTILRSKTANTHPPDLNRR